MGKFLYLLAAVALLLAVLPLAAVARPPADTALIEAELLDRLRAEGVANFFVKMAVEADLSAAYDIADWEARGEYVYATLQAVAASSQVAVVEYAERQGLDYTSFLTTNAVFIRGGNLEAAHDLASLPGVAYLRLERVLSLPEPVPGVDEGAPGSLPEGSPTWGILDTGANQVWALGVRGAGIKVANIDSGVQWNHPALVGQFACPGNPSNPACWRDPSNICGGSACDNIGHGTHTMGTMVASNDPALPYLAGMAPNATWIACKGCESEECSDYALNTCADWILAPAGNAANRPHIVNNSWGGNGGNTWYLSKVNAWRAAGIFPAFSAGNLGQYGCSTLGSPGDYQQSFSSAAHDSSGAIAYFSSRGPSAFGHTPYTKPNISAPGVSVCSTVPGGWSCGYNGTSMASPHSAGAVALLWSGCASYRGQINQTFELLQDSADAAPAGSCGAPDDGEGTYTYGYGYLNVLAAIQSCAVPPAPVLSAISNPDYDGSYLVDWSDVSSATGYTLQEDDNPSFSSPATRYSGPTSQFQISGQGEGTWYYRVRASNGAGNSPWSNTQSATVISVPAAPQLQPIANSGNDDAYLVAWSSVPGASSYTLQEATSSTFAGATTRYAGSAVQYSVTGQAGGTWYYRVRASNAAGDSPWSNVEMTTVDPRPLGKPTLSPISNSDGDGAYTVQWSQVSGATGYILEQSSSAYFVSPAGVFTGSATEFLVAAQPGGTWHYRVRASGPTGNGPWSDPQSVVVRSKVHLPLLMREYGVATLPAVLYSVADACVLEGYPNTNRGSTVDMWAGYDDYLNPDGMIARSLVQFDLSGIPAGTTITQATLRLYLALSWDYPYRYRTITTHRASGGWSEGSITWTNKPSYAEAYGSASIQHAAWGWHSFDVTGLVQQWVNGTAANQGIMVRGPEVSGSDSSWRGFSTREGLYDPELRLSYSLTGAGETAPAPTAPEPEQPPTAAEKGLAVSPEMQAGSGSAILDPLPR